MTEQPEPSDPSPMPDYPLDDAARDEDPTKDDQLPPPGSEQHEPDGPDDASR